MNKKLKWFLQWTLFVIIIIAFIFIGTRDFSSKVVIDNERFDLEYPTVSKDNVFKYTNAREVYSLFKGGSAIVFMGFPANPWSGPYANILNEAAKENNIKEILYYDFYEDRENRNGTYQSIVLALSNYLPVLDENNQNIYAPTLIIIKKGQVIAYDDETAIINGNIKPEEHWTNFNIELKKNAFASMFQEYLKKD